MTQGVSALETPLTAWHRQHGAKMVEFGGYWMPLEYTGILDEHHAVRTQVGMFDVSHMGEFLVIGQGAVDFVDRVTTNRPGRLEVGQAAYGAMCQEDGGTLDDLVVYRRAVAEFMLVVNAARRQPDWDWLSLQREREGGSVRLTDLSDTLALIAVQGPQAMDRMKELAGPTVAELLRFRFSTGFRIAGRPTLISRTGYTGEDGVEIYTATEDALEVWEVLAAREVKPIGLGARDTLRLEAGLPLYGHELATDISPVEAGLRPFIRTRPDQQFIGQAPLLRQLTVGPERMLIGLRMEEGGAIARSGYPVYAERQAEAEVGRVTSGSYAPALRRPMAMALVAAEQARPDTTLWVAIRGKRVPGRVVPLPFYRRSRGPRSPG